MRAWLVLGLMVGVCSVSRAQVAAPKPAPLPATIASHPEWPVAKAEDVKSVEALVAALYDVISGPKTKQRDWNRFRSLFLPEGKLGVIRPATAAVGEKPASAGDVIFLTPETYVAREDVYFKTQGFFERGIANRMEEFGNLIAVWSTYESRHAAEDAKPFARGVNSIQIAHAAGRYWVVSIVWDDEREGLVLPEKYLKTP